MTVYPVIRFPPSDLGRSKLTVAEALPAVADTFLGGSGRRRSTGGLTVPTPPPPPPPIAKDVDVTIKTAKIVIAIALPVIVVPPVDRALNLNPNHYN
jgi:hypothetical protein